jgi:hypothetical protein
VSDAASLSSIAIFVNVVLPIERRILALVDIVVAAYRPVKERQLHICETRRTPTDILHEFSGSPAVEPSAA